MYEVSTIESFGKEVMAHLYQFETISQREMFLRMCEEDGGVIIIVHNSKPKELQEVL